MRIALVGISHRQAPVELRERVAVDLDGASELARSLSAAGEAVVLSTCNRTELYVASDRPVALEDVATEALLELAGDGRHELAPVLYRLSDETAALHLFRVAAGLDSLVPGEGEILGQVRDAFDAGATGPLLDRLFRQALHAGRRARVETAIGESPASVPAAAAALAQQVFEELEGRSVVLVGAGRMSELTARNLLSRGARISAVANRTVENATELAPSSARTRSPSTRLPAELAAADVVVTSTTAPGFVLDAETVGPALRERRGRPVLLVDLAVPRDVDPRSPRSTGASSTTSTTSRPSSRRRSPAVARRRSAPSGSSPPRPSGSASGRPRSRSCRRSRRCAPAPRRSASPSSPGGGPARRLCPRASAGSSRR